MSRANLYSLVFYIQILVFNYTKVISYKIYEIITLAYKIRSVFLILKNVFYDKYRYYMSNFTNHKAIKQNLFQLCSIYNNSNNLKKFQIKYIFISTSI